MTFWKWRRKAVAEKPGTMNLKQLEVLKAVMASGSTVGASAILQLSQSAISRHLHGSRSRYRLRVVHPRQGPPDPASRGPRPVPEVEELTDVLGRVKRKVTDLKSGPGSDTLLAGGVSPQHDDNGICRASSSAFSPKGRASSSRSCRGLTAPSSRWSRQGRTDLGFVRLPTEDQGFDIRPLLRGGTSRASWRKIIPSLRRDVGSP